MRFGNTRKALLAAHSSLASVRLVATSKAVLAAIARGSSGDCSAQC